MAVVVLINEDALQSRLISDNLRTSGYTVLCTSQKWEALLLSYQVRPDLIIVGFDLPAAVEVLTLLRAMRGLSKTPVLLIASRHPSKYHLQKLGVACCVDKSIDANVLMEQTQRLVACVNR